MAFNRNDAGPSGECRGQSVVVNLQALVYDILPSTTALFSYAIGSRKLSANEQFFVGAQTVVSLLQTIQIKQGVSFTDEQFFVCAQTVVSLLQTAHIISDVCFITDHAAYASSNKNKIV